MRSAIGSNSPVEPSRFDIVVDSPPGITRASTSSSSAGVRTSAASAPIERSRSTWAANAPWSASTPILIAAGEAPGGDGGTWGLLATRHHVTNRASAKRWCSGTSSMAIPVIGAPSPRLTLARMPASV